MILARGRHLTRAMLAVAALSVVSSSCERVPLLAPTGSAITLTASATVLPANGSTQIIAQVLEAAGTPPHSGTHVTFLTTLGRVVPNDIETDVSGRAIVTFFSGDANGTATISAVSGGATTGTDRSVRIAIGTAAVGHVFLNANPTAVSANGGTSTLTATVVDQNSNPLPSVAVNFSATAGSLGSLIVTTNAAGVATTTITTAQQTTVTASVGAQGANGGSGSTPGGGGTATTPTSTQTSSTVTINVLAAPTIAISAPTTISEGIPATFTFTVTAAAQNGSPIRSVTVSWGDGTSPQSLGTPTGAQNATHTYMSDGAFTVVATVTDAAGSSNETRAPIFVLERVHPAVSVSAVPSAITLNTTTPTVAVAFTITIDNPARGTLDATISYGDNSADRFSTTSTVTKTHPYSLATLPSSVGNFVVVIVDVVDRADGSTTSASTTVVINR